MAKRPAPPKPTTSTKPQTSSGINTAASIKKTESLIRANDSQPKPK